MTPPVRIAVIGTGFGQKVHVPAFRADDRCEVVAICAATPQSAARAAEQAGIPQAYGDVHEMLATAQIDAVSIAVPPAAQPQLVIEAAKAGKHVFCEKPLATEREAAAEALAAVERAGVTHAIDFIFPEISSWQRARSVLREGKLGKLRHAALTWRVETYAFAAGLDSWKTQSQCGGGAVNNFLSHSLYYLEWLLGPFARVAAQILPRDSRRNARVDAWFETESQCSVTASIANDAFLGSGHRLEIYGERGSLVLSNTTNDYITGFTLSVGTRESRSLSTELSEPPSGADGRIEAVSKIARRFLDAILSGTPVTPNLAHGVRVQHLIAKVCAADETGTWQSV
ncbi:MAG: Gfo/Idh/MocA family protein [Candidatus Acidiferrales bacterium]